MMDRRSVVFTVSNDLISDRRMTRICNTLHDQGYDVTIIGRVLPRSSALPERRFRQRRIRCWFNKDLPFYAELNMRLLIYLWRNKFDIITAIDNDTILAGVLAKTRERKLAFDAHEWFEEVPELKNRYLVKWIWSKIGSVCIKYSDIRYTVSESLAFRLGQRYSMPFAVIRNYPEIGGDGNPDSTSTDKRDKVVYVGVLNEGRGLEQAILAMKKIEAELWIVGEGDLSSGLRQLASINKLEKKVVFKGWVPPDSLRSILSKARIGLNLLNLESRSYYYSLANKFFDYVHAGVPSLNMRFPEYVRYNEQHEVSILLDELNEDVIAESIHRLLYDESEWQNLHQNCLLAARSWCWEEESKQLVRLYDTL